MADHTVAMDGSRLAYLRESVRWFHERQLSPFLAVLRNLVTHAGISKSLIDLEANLQALLGAINTGKGHPTKPGDSLHEVPVRLLPLAKRVLLVYRRHLVAQTESQIELVTDLEIRANLERVIANTKVYNNELWFVDTKPLNTPRLTDHLTLQQVEKILSKGTAIEGMGNGKVPAKQYDDKFGVLSAPSTLAPELAYWRQQCELRNVGIALAYFDIDDFKVKFNTPHSETVIDRQCLPVIARAIEAHVFSHGAAYHEGGDEFIVLMPNSTKESSIDFMDSLRDKMPSLIFPGIESKAFISIGICHVGPDSLLTEAEIKHHANLAKVHAKRNAGKNCVATFRGEKYVEDELVIVRPNERATA